MLVNISQRVSTELTCSYSRQLSNPLVYRLPLFCLDLQATICATVVLIGLTDAAEAPAVGLTIAPPYQCLRCRAKCHQREHLLLWAEPLHTSQGASTAVGGHRCLPSWLMAGVALLHDICMEVFLSGPVACEEGAIGASYRRKQEANRTISYSFLERAIPECSRLPAIINFWRSISGNHLA